MRQQNMLAPRRGELRRGFPLAPLAEVARGAMGGEGGQEYIALRCWRVLVQQMRLQHFQFTTPNCLPVSSGFRIRIAIHIGIIRNWIFTH